jgi:hypothetical protein
MPRCATRGCESDVAVAHQLEELSCLLLEAEGALALERSRRRRAERDLVVVESALLRLLRATGARAADRREMRLELGLPA